MLTVAHFSKADSVKGQGVGSAYLELIRLQKTRLKNQLTIKINDYASSDISHYHTINPQYFLTSFFKKRGVKVGYVHFLPDTLAGSIKLLGPLQKLMERYVIAFYKQMDQLVVVNPSFIPEIAAYGIDPNEVTYIPNFVSDQEFFPKDEVAKKAFRLEQDIDQDQFVVLGVGQIQKRKGIDDFIRLAQMNPDKLFVWVGGFSFGRITDGYEDYKKIYDNPPANVRFTGIVDRPLMNDWYNLADVFLLPSYNELFPMSILEAFSTHTPVLVRDLDLYRDVIDGYYLAAKDVSSWTDCLNRLASDASFYQEKLDRAKQGADYYHPDRIAKIWLDYYRSLVKK
ncbi:MAG: glycosyltransferase family 4 protein [Facklamia hominis]